MVKYRIDLTKLERKRLRTLLSKGKHGARKLTRARILLFSDEDKTSGEIVEVFGVGRATVGRLRKH